MTETAGRIRWEDKTPGNSDVYNVASIGYVGTVEESAFIIYPPDGPHEDWLLPVRLTPGGQFLYGGNQDEPDCSAVTRFEVIDHTTDSKQQSVRYSPDNARSVVARNARVAASFQDDGRTLKVFLADPETTAAMAREKE